jgi:hypothetical protein
MVWTKMLSVSQHSTKTKPSNASAQRRRQMPTVWRSHPTRSAVSSLSSLSNAHRIIRARWATPWGQVLERVKVTSTFCWRSVIVTFAALPGIARPSWIS